MQEFKVGKLAVGMRADFFVAGKYPQFARSALKTLFERQNVHINEKIAKPGYKLRYGDKISVDSGVLLARPKVIDLPVVYEDEAVVVINKPTGILTHSKGSLNLEPTVASFIESKLKNRKMIGSRAGIVHRLDRNTSGLIIGAKTSTALKFLQRRFSTRRVKKTYLAIVEGRPDPEAAVIDAPIGRNLRRPQTFRVTPTGRPAQTEYRVLHTFSKGGQVFSILELKPVTGRTHQLRIHLAYIGHPIVGDAVYGHGGAAMLLHAEKLDLTLPNGDHRIFSVPPPDSFKDFQQQ